MAVHVFTPLPQIYDGAGFPAADWFFRFVRAFIKDQSVPVYFFIAGYVFFLGMSLTMDSYMGKIRRRCHSLLIPYIVWNAVAILYVLKVMLPGMGAVSDFADTSQLDLSLSSFIESFWDDSYGIIPYVNSCNDGTFPIDKPLWFVRDLMLMALVSPAFYALYKLPRITTRIVLAGATLVWAVKIPGLGHLAQLLEAFVFFAWGGYLSYHKRDMILFLAPLWPQAMTYVKSVNIVVGLFFFYNISAWLVSHGRCRASAFLSSASFFIYCGHFIILDPVARRVFALTGSGGDMAVMCGYLLTYTVIIGILLGAYALMRRYTPRFLALFTGGRV